ncbi:hypothetical protein B5772_00035 [Dolosigranulum pigrum]|nr:hypothetical protein B5772_00035 [Dolosigranulum pigrum]
MYAFYESIGVEIYQTNDARSSRADGQLQEFSELREAPTDLSTYFIRAQASNMKDIVLPVASIDEVQKDGDVVYEVKTTSDETVHRDGISLSRVLCFM